MKNLCLLTLVAMGIQLWGLAAADSTILCSGNNVPASTLFTQVPGTYTATGCSFSGLVSISGATIPAGDEGINVLVSGSFVGSASALQILGPSESVASSRCPFRVTVKGNTFTEGIFRFQGSLPPNSFLIFEDNTVFGSVRNPLTGLSDLYMGLVSIASAALISVNTDSFIAVHNNHITANTMQETYGIVCTAITLQRNSAFKVTHNTITLDVKSGAGVGLWFAPSNWAGNSNDSPLTFAADFASFSANENTIFINAATAPNAFTFSGGFQLASLSLVGTEVSFSNNVMTLFAVDIASYAPQIRIWKPSAFNTFLVKNNQFTMSGRGAIVSFDYGSLTPNGKMEISGNTFGRPGFSIETDVIYLGWPFNLGSGASILVTCNTVIAEGLASPALFFYSARDPSLEKRGALYYGGNTFSWLANKELTADQQFNSYVAPYAENVGSSSCMRHTSVFGNATTTSIAATLDGNVTSIADPNATTTTAQPSQINGVSATATLLSKVLLGASMAALSAFAMA